MYDLLVNGGIVAVVHSQSTRMVDAAIEFENSHALSTFCAHSYTVCAKDGTHSQLRCHSLI